jgi:putative hydrolase of the HAD superfamily
MSSHHINAIVFDVGRVLIDFSYDDFFDWLTQHGANINDVESFVRQTDLHAYEHGHMDDDAFLARLNQLLSQPVDRQLLLAQWLDLFAPIEEMLQLARQLKTRYRVFMLSNTSALHWQHIIPHYKLETYCHGLLASYEVGAMKPDPAIFRAAEQKFELSAGETVFIDDIEDNVSGARACGWQGIHHRNSRQTRRKLQQLGVILD